MAKAKGCLISSGKGILGEMDQTNMPDSNTQDALITALSSINQNAIWASVLWGGIAGGYCVYGWKQKSMIPWLCGFGMTMACFMSTALWMSVTCIAIMIATHWLLKREG